MKGKNTLMTSQNQRQEQRDISPIRKLSDKEIQAIGGGFFGALIAAVAAVLAGCATIPHKGDRD